MAWSVRDNEVRMEEGITLDEWSKEINSSVVEKTELEQIKNAKYDNVEINNNNIKFYANSSLKKTITLTTPEVVNDLTTGGTNKVLSAEQGKKLNEGKIDDVELSGNELIFKCNGVEKKRITLPTGAGA